jgi:hypothetical protein
MANTAVFLILVSMLNFNTLINDDYSWDSKNQPFQIKQHQEFFSIKPIHSEGINSCHNHSLCTKSGLTNKTISFFIESEFIDYEMNTRVMLDIIKNIKLKNSGQNFNCIDFCN